MGRHYVRSKFRNNFYSYATKIISTFVKRKPRVRNLSEESIIVFADGRGEKSVSYTAIGLFNPMDQAIRANHVSQTNFFGKKNVNTKKYIK